MRYKEKISTFMRFADDLSKLSTCKRPDRKTGCIIFPGDCSQIYSIGYNGPARGLPNDSCSGEPGNCGCAHAEANAVTKLGDVKGAMLYTTRVPCKICAGIIINSNKISTVIVGADHYPANGLFMLAQADIGVESFEKFL